MLERDLLVAGAVVVIATLGSILVVLGGVALGLWWSGVQLWG
jgi:hypothetical protein